MRRQDAATDAAYAAADDLGANFTSITQIPPAVRDDLPPATIDALTRQAGQNAVPQPVAENGDTVAGLNLQLSRDPSAFAQQDLRLVRDLMTPREYATLTALQSQLRTDPAAPPVVAQRRILATIARDGPDLGIDLASPDPAIRQRAQALAAAMATDLAAETAGKRLPTDEEIVRSFQRQADLVVKADPHIIEDVKSLTNEQFAAIHAFAQAFGLDEAQENQAVHEFVHRKPAGYDLSAFRRPAYFLPPKAEPSISAWRPPPTRPRVEPSISSRGPGYFGMGGPLYAIGMRVEQARELRAEARENIRSVDASLAGVGRGALGAAQVLGSDAAFVIAPVRGAVDLLSSAWAGRGTQPSQEDQHKTDMLVTLASVVAPELAGASGGAGVGSLRATELGGGSLPVTFDGDFATSQLLGTSRTPSGRQIMFHAAQQMTAPPAGRIPMSPSEIDDVLNGATSIIKRNYYPRGDTLLIENSNLPGRPRVVVDEGTGMRIITVIKKGPKINEQ